MGSEAGLFSAFVGGVLSFLSPCVLPLVPSYLGFLTGMTAEEMQVDRRRVFVHALWFVAGFSLIFVILGATASALGSLLQQYQTWIARIGGVILILFGLYLLGERLHIDRGVGGREETRPREKAERGGEQQQEQRSHDKAILARPSSTRFST